MLDLVWMLFLWFGFVVSLGGGILFFGFGIRLVVVSIICLNSMFVDYISKTFACVFTCFVCLLIYCI